LESASFSARELRQEDVEVVGLIVAILKKLSSATRRLEIPS